MISQSLTLLGLSLLSVFVWGSNASGQDEFTSIDAPWCSGLGESTVDTLAGFRLYAWNTDRQNDNSTGVPLVLATTGATATAHSHTFAVSLRVTDIYTLRRKLTIYSADFGIIWLWKTG